MGNDNRKKEKKTDSSCDEDEEVVCCKHGRPCRIAQAKSREKQRNRNEEDQSEIVYENITENDVTTEKEAASVECESHKEASVYENIPDGGLGTKPEATARDDDEKSSSDEDEGVSTAKEQDDNDTSNSGPPKSFKRSKAQNKVLAEIETRAKAKAGQTNSCAETTYNSERDKQDRKNPKEEELLMFYMGLSARKEAEEQCKCDSFRLYHRIDGFDKNFLQDVLPLFIVYRNSRGNYRHIRILRSSNGKDNLLHVDIPGEPKFYSMTSLITFYDIYASFDNNFEPFPNKVGTSQERSIRDEPNDENTV